MYAPGIVLAPASVKCPTVSSFVAAAAPIIDARPTMVFMLKMGERWFGYLGEIILADYVRYLTESDLFIFGTILL